MGMLDRRECLVTIVLCALVVATLARGGEALAQPSPPAEEGGAWLDAPLSNWNRPGMPIPKAPTSTDPRVDDPVNARCFQDRRLPETAEDETVVGAGWTLFGMYRSGWGYKIIGGLAGYDGMCRPADFNIFVFVDGVFAGTVAPEPMYARSDGVNIDVSALPRSDWVYATFARYSDIDPFCCPSRTSHVDYHVDRTPAGPVLVPDGVRTVDRPPT